MKVIFLMMASIVLSHLPAEARGEATDVKSIFNDGVQAYDEGKFEKAVSFFTKAYKELSSKGNQGDVDRGKLLFNVGNAYYKIGDYSAAFAAYLAARLYMPRDAELKANMGELKQFIKDDIRVELPINKNSSFFPFLEHFTSSELGLLLSFLFLLLASGSLLIKNPELRRTGFVSLVSAVILGCAFYFIYTKKHGGDISYVVSQKDMLDVMSSPGKAGVGLYKVSKGTPLEILSEVGPYYKVSIPGAIDLKKGWVKKSEIIFF